MPSSNEVLVSASLPQIAIWFLIVFPSISILLWASTKVALGRSIWRLDCGFLLLTLLLAIFQTVALSISITNGLGHSPQAAGSSYGSALKAQYASNILYIIVLGSTKFTCIYITSTLIPWCRALYHNINIGLYSLTALSTVASLFAVAFQCNASHPWLYSDAYTTNSSHCINRKQFWSAIEGLNILTDVLLIILPICITSTLKTCAFRRTGLCIIYAMRIAPAIAAIVKITYIAGDETPDDLCISLLTEIIQALSIGVTALSDPRIVIEVMQPNFLVHRDHTGRRNRCVHKHANLFLPRPPAVSIRPRAPRAHWPFTHPFSNSSESKVDLNNDVKDIEKAQDIPEIHLDPLNQMIQPQRTISASRRSSEGSRCSSLSDMEKNSRLAFFANRLRRLSRGGTVSEVSSVSPRSRVWPAGMVRHTQSCSAAGVGAGADTTLPPPAIKLGTTAAAVSNAGLTGSSTAQPVQNATTSPCQGADCQCRSVEAIAPADHGHLDHGAARDGAAAMIIHDESGVMGEGIGVVRNVSVSCEVLPPTTTTISGSKKKKKDNVPSIGEEGIGVMKMTHAQRAVIAPWTL